LFVPRCRVFTVLKVHQLACILFSAVCPDRSLTSTEDLVAGGIPSLFFGGSKKKDAVSRSVSHDPSCHGSGGKLAVAEGGTGPEEQGKQTTAAEGVAESPRRVEVVTPKARTASDSAVVPLIGRGHHQGGGALAPLLRDCRGTAVTGEWSNSSTVPGCAKVTEVRPDAGSHSPRERRLFGPATGKLSPMVALKVPKIEDLKKYHLHDRSSSKSKSQDIPNAQESSSCSSEVPSKLGFSSKDSSKKSLCQSQALHSKANCSDKLGERRVPCPDLGVAECEGWLLRRKAQKAPVMRLQQPQQPPQPQPAWHRRWALLRGTGLFLYRTPQDQKAECLLFVPGFLVSLAPDCKSNNCAFKLCNSGATFYFASESQVDTLRWLTKLSQALRFSDNILCEKFAAQQSKEDAVAGLARYCEQSTWRSFSKQRCAAHAADSPRQSPRPMPRTIFLRSTLADKSATLSPRRTTGEPPTVVTSSNSSLPRNHMVPPPSNLPIGHESSSSMPSVIYQNPPHHNVDASSSGQGDSCLQSRQRLSGVWDGDVLGSRPPPARREPPNPRCKPPTGHYVNVGFKHKEKDATQTTQASTWSVAAGDGASRLAPSRPVQRRPSASKLSRSKTADSVAEATPKKETLLDREYNRVFKKSPSTSSSPDPAHSSDGSAPSPIPANSTQPHPATPVSTSHLPRCATSQEIKDLYTNRRNSWRGSQQELVALSTNLGDVISHPQDASTPDYALTQGVAPTARPDVIPSQYQHNRSAKTVAEEQCPDPWIPRDRGPPRSSSCFQGFERSRGASGDKLSSPFVRAGSCVPSMHCRTEQPSPPPKSPSRFFHSPKFLKKFASSTREGISNMLRSPRLERRKMSSERDMYGSPKLSRSAGVRLLKSSAAAAASSASVEADETSPLANKSGSSSSLNSSASAGSFVTSSSSSHCYAEVFVAPGVRPDTPDTPPPRTPSRPTMGVSMLRGGKRRTSSSVAGSEERSFSPCSVASSSASVPWARDDGSVFGDDASHTGDVFQFGTATAACACDGGSEHALGSGSERD
ncbi:unnamed protein product, partial [Ixodes hexagonus]